MLVQKLRFCYSLSDLDFRGAQTVPGRGCLQMGSLGGQLRRLGNRVGWGARGAVPQVCIWVGKTTDG